MNVVKLLFWLAGFFVFIKASQYFMAIKLLLNLRFKKSGGELKNINELPEYLERLLPRYDIKLQGLGFSFSHLHLLDAPIVSNYSQQWNIVYFNQANKCFASLVISAFPETFEPVKAEFSNIFSDGNKLITVNGIEHEVIGEIPNTIVNDLYAPTLQEQYQGHIEKLISLGRESIVLSPEKFLSSEAESQKAYIDSLIQQSWLKSKDQTTWQLRLIPAMKHAFKILLGMKKATALKNAQRKAADKQNTEPIDVPIEVEVNSYLRQQDTFKSSGAGFGWKIMVFLVSLVVGIAVFGTIFPGMAAVFIIAALIVHELGHYIGMLIFRYSDRQILFLPFGAATLGEKIDATAWQRAVVYLLGPAVGLISGTALMIVGTALEIHTLSVCGSFFLILNYINLLPIVPLDGGRLFELALFSRAPVLKSVFLILSVSVMAIGAIVTRGPFLIIITLFMAIGTKAQILANSVHSKINKKIKRQQIEPDKETLLSEIFGMLKQKSFVKLPFTQKYTIARNLMNNLSQKPPNIGVAIISLFLYVTVVALPVIIVVGFGVFVGLTK